MNVGFLATIAWVKVFFLPSFPFLGTYMQVLTYIEELYSQYLTSTANYFTKKKKIGLSNLQVIVLVYKKSYLEIKL